MKRLLIVLFSLAAAVMFAAGAFFASRLLITSGFALLVGFAVGVALRRKSDWRNTEHQPGDAKDLHQKLLDVALNEMREGVVVIDTDMRVVASNRAALGLFTSANPIRSRLTELTRNPAIYDAFLDAVQGKDRDGVRLETYGNGHKVFDLRVVPLRSPGGARVVGAVGVFFDISRLERLEIVRQEFLANVSHELRTPLTSIPASAETLESSADNDSNSNRRFLSIIHKNAARMQRLINDLLELSDRKRHRRRRTHQSISTGRGCRE